MFNREGPNVTCADLKDGRINACEDGIIASCKDGQTVTHEVCTESDGATSAEEICEASWQKHGAYVCEESSTAVRGGGGSGGAPPVGTGGSGSISNCDFHCADNSCVTESEVCNGHADCPDASDETPAACAANLQFGITLTCTGYSSAEVTFFDYDASKAEIAQQTVAGSEKVTIDVPCTRHHRICFGAKSGNGIWGAYAPPSGQLSDNPDPNACAICEEGSGFSAKLEC
jgi:hypothetical protein